MYTGIAADAHPSSAPGVLNAAQNNGERVVVNLAGGRQYFKNADGTFNITKWKSRVGAYKTVNLGQYISSGAVVGRSDDEPTCMQCWGGKQITNAQLEEMAKYSKSLWPSMPTGVRAAPTKLGTASFSSLDFAWAQWEGPLHQPSYRMTPQQYRDTQVAAAQKLGLGLVFGLNYLDGGDGSSHINGTYAQDPYPKDNNFCKSNGNCYRYQMTAAEVNVGSVLVGAAYACGLISWEYNSTFLSRSGVKDALAAVSSVSKNRSRTTCVK